MIGFVFMFIIMKRSQKYFVDRQESLGTLNGYIEEMFPATTLCAFRARMTGSRRRSAA